MAGSKINDYGVGDVDLTSLMETTDAQRIGYHSVTLTNYDNTTKPEIAAGSKIEVNGGLYKFDSNETITGSPADGTVYIRLVPSGDSITAEFTATAPTWADDKQGWYGTGGASNYRYVNFIMTKSGTSYSDKRYYVHDPMKNVENFGNVDIGTLEVDNFATTLQAQDGYIKLGAIYVQWGFYDDTSGSGGTRIATFPLAFPNNCYSVTLGEDKNSDAPLTVSGLLTTQFTLNGTPLSLFRGYYIAVGD